MGTLRLCLAFVLVVSTFRVLALPDLRQSKQAGDLLVYPDTVKAGLYYYPPGEIVLAADDVDGRPDLSFLQMRYTGSVASADQGTALFRSVLTFHVKMDGPSAKQLARARKELSSALKRRIELRPLPIRKLDAALVYAGAEETGDAAEERPMENGHFEPEGEINAGEYWRDRIYTLGLDNTTSQLFWDALQKGQVVLSLGYAFYADGIGDKPLAQLSGSPAVVEALQAQVGANPEPPAATSALLVKSGATAIRVDAKRWPNMFHQVDINESVPPGYPALDIYCYDFNNQLRPDLAEKQVEIDAEGVGGRRIKLLTIFRQGEPDLYARGVRFPLAIRLDRPFRYQVIEIDMEGNTVESPWRDQTSWTELLDVTSSERSVQNVPPSEEP